MRRMFLNGTAMSGQKDHGAIAGATFVGPARTAPRYRFFAVRDEFPGLFPVDLSVATSLVTTHVPLAKVPGLLTPNGIAEAAVWLARQKHASSQIRTAIVLEVGDLRQVGELDLLEIVRRRRDLRRERRAAHQLDPAPAERAVLGADHVHQPGTAAEDVGHHRKARPGHVVEQQRRIAFTLRGLRHRREFVFATDFARDLAHRAGALQLFEIIPHCCYS